VKGTAGCAVAVCHLISGFAALIFDFAAVAAALDGGFVLGLVCHFMQLFCIGFSL
jgi:hypothetical protein